MNIKKFFLSISLSLALILFVSHQGWTQAKPETKKPIITNAYAIDKEQYGSILKIYLEADDPDGDMLRIATVVDQLGYGYYQTDWTYIKPQNRHHLVGYLQWNTFSSKASTINDRTYITIRVSIFDKAGNESNEVVFPFIFDTGTGSKPKLPAPFDQGNIQRLGHIMIDLVGRDDHHEVRIWPD